MLIGHAADPRYLGSASKPSSTSPSSPAAHGVVVGDRKFLQARPQCPDPLADGRTDIGQAGQLSMVRAERGDHRQAVQQSLPGGRGAPAPVLVRQPRELVRPSAVRPFDQRVTPDQPARARLGEIPAGLGTGEGAPRRPVRRLGLPERGSGDRRGAPSGGEADPQVSQSRGSRRTQPATPRERGLLGKRRTTAGEPSAARRSSPSGGPTRVGLCGSWCPLPC
jgi:hypothetical protein